MERFICLVVAAAVGVVVAPLEAIAQGGREDAIVKHIDFKGRPTSPADQGYAGGSIKGRYEGDGECSLAARIPRLELGGWGWRGKFVTGDLVGVAGGVYRANCGEGGATFERVAAGGVPKGAIVPEWDSVTIPTGGSMSLGKRVKSGAFWGTIVSHPTITGGAREGSKAELEVDYRPDGFPHKATVTVKTGDYLFIDKKGHLIRAIIPPNKESRVVGWVEISAEPTPEANLVRNKKSIVRPKFETEKK